MRYGFDLDGTLDRREIGALAKHLLATGHEVHIITSIFPESGDWQSKEAKKEKLNRLGILWKEPGSFTKLNAAALHVIPAEEQGTIEERLRVIGLRKGVLTETLGIDVYFDDSSTYCEMIPRMDGHVTVLRVM
jgi:hypothetical protein